MTALQHMLVELLGVGEEQRCIPAEEHQPGDEACIRVAGEIVVALYTICPTQHRIVRSPAIPDELQQGNDNGEQDARDGSKDRHPQEAGDGKPELPLLDAVQTLKVVNLEQTDALRQSPPLPGLYLGRFCNRLGAKTSSSAMTTAPIIPVSCVFEPADSATGVREELLLIENPWKKPRRDVGSSQPDQLLVRIDRLTAAGGVGCARARWYRQKPPLQ